MRWAGHVAHVEEVKNAHKILVVKLERKRPLWRRMREWEDDITTQIK
jgi:hypothetical protein